MTDNTYTEFPAAEFGSSYDPFGANGKPAEDPTAPDENYTQPDPNVAQEKKRTPTAKRYEAKMNGVMSSLFKASVNKPGYVADAAAISLYGGNFAEKVGDVAAHDPRIAKFLDTLDGGVDNPYLALVAAGLPFALQLIRNHEPQLEPNVRLFRIPFSKSKKRPQGRTVTFKKLGIKLGFLRHQTDDPERLYRYVFDENPMMRPAMEAQKITVARFPGDK